VPAKVPVAEVAVDRNYRDKLLRRGSVLRGSQHLRANLGNAGYGLVDYIAQPTAMIISARFLVHRLGLEQFGVWMLVSAVLGGLGILGTGFGDATVKYVSMYRAQDNIGGVQRTIRATLTMNVVLGSILAAGMWGTAPSLVHHLLKIEAEFQLAAIRSIQIGAIILFLRSVESVFVSTLRGFEQYAPTVMINTIVRIMNVISAVVLAAFAKGVVAIMLSSLLWSAISISLQVVSARRVAGRFSMLPGFGCVALREVFVFGGFSWLQALAGLGFSYADRLLVGILLGTAPVAVYVLCVQASQPIHGLCAATFNFLFPHISTRHELEGAQSANRVFHAAFWCNLAISLALAAPLIFFGKSILRLWMSEQIAANGQLSLRILALAYTLLAFNVVPHYTLLALRQAKYVSMVNLAGATLSLAAASVLIPSWGLRGAAFARLMYGLTTLVLFLRVKKALTPSSSTYEKADVVLTY